MELWRRRVGMCDIYNGVGFTVLLLQLTKAIQWVVVFVLTYRHVKDVVVNSRKDRSGMSKACAK